MTEKLIELLKNSRADAWEVTESQETGWEFYLIRHRLDQHRTKRLETISLKVYRSLEEGKFLGSAGATLPPDATEQEMQKLIDGLYEDAAYVRNPFYRLNQPVREETAEEMPADLARVSADFLKTMRSLQETATEDLNSYEIFVSDVRTRYRNSEGVDVTSRSPSSMVEAVVNARQHEKEIELYRLYHCGTCDAVQLTHDLNETLRIGRDRLAARATPALGKADVVFSTEASAEIYGWFIAHLMTDMVYRKMSDWKIGKDICPDRKGDAVTVKSLRFLPNSSCNGAFDREGAPVQDRTLMEAGVPLAFTGSRQFSQYLGLENSYIPGNLEVTGGTANAESLREGTCLEVMEFSDFQVDAMTGDIAGEIRLAYLHENGNHIPVSGGSISGNMRDFLGTMRMSRESAQYNSLRIPAVTRLQGVNIAGA